MNESETKFEGRPDAGSGDLRHEVQSLRNTVTMALLFTFIISFCVNIFLLHQVSVLGSQAGEAQQMLTNFQGGAAQVVDFWGRLNEYAKTHPDFAPVLQKYSRFINIRTNAPTAAATKK